MRRVYTASGGDPLFALTIARELRVGLAAGIDERDLPVPDSLTDALARRLDGVDGRTDDVMLAVADGPHSPHSGSWRAVIPDFTLADLDRGVREGLIEISRGNR